MNQPTEFWAIIELFGHAKMAGQINKSDLGDFIQVNIPAVGIIPAWSKLINPKAIYAITPCKKEDAIAKAETLKLMPIDKWDTEQLIKNRLQEMELDGKIKKIEPSIEFQDEDEDELF